MHLRRMAGGFAALGLATGYAQLIGFAILAVAARRLGPEGIGAFSFVASLVAYFAIPANFGVTALGTRDVARQPEAAREVAGEILVLQSALVALPYLVLAGLASVLAPNDLAQVILPIIGLTFVLDALSLQWVLYGHHRFGLLALSRVAGATVSGALILGFLDAGRAGVLQLAWFTVAAVAVTSAVTLGAVLRTSGFPLVRGVGARRVLRRLRASAPLGVAAVMISVYYSIDSVMLGYIKGTDVVGQYAVAYKIPLAIIAIAALWGSVLYPYASDIGVRDPERLRRELTLFGALSLVAALPLAVGAVVLGPDLMPVLFGAQFEPAGSPFVLLMMAAVVVIFSMSYGTVAIGVGDERQYAVAVTLGAVLNLAANAVLIPAFGMEGAAVATIAAELIVVSYVMYRLRRILGSLRLPLPRLARAVVAAAAMGLTLALLPESVPVLAQVVVGAVVYTVAVIALRAVHPVEVRMVLAMRRGAAAPGPEPAVATTGPGATPPA